MRRCDWIECVRPVVLVIDDVGYCGDHAAKPFASQCMAIANAMNTRHLLGDRVGIPRLRVDQVEP